MIKVLKEQARQLLMAWAERQKMAQRRRAQEWEDTRKEAEDFVLNRIVGNDCIHFQGGPYCDDCPVGNLHGPLSYQASKMICTRTRHYSK